MNKKGKKLDIYLFSHTIIVIKMAGEREGIVPRVYR